MGSVRNPFCLVDPSETTFVMDAESEREGLETEVVAAAKAANAHQFISEFADGYDTQIGANGLSLSAGQKQRVCIARALIKRPSLLLLDEATSALDGRSEHLVAEALRRSMDLQSTTSIVIAHRLSTIRHAQSIAVVHKGK